MTDNRRSYDTHFLCMKKTDPHHSGRVIPLTCKRKNQIIGEGRTILSRDIKTKKDSQLKQHLPRYLTLSWLPSTLNRFQLTL